MAGLAGVTVEALEVEKVTEMEVGRVEEEMAETGKAVLSEGAEADWED